MDAFNLRTASTYVNNLLLARGLSNGTPIDFAKPSKAEGGTDATMAQIINIMHNLLLRRDREQEQRESLVQTVRSLRTQADRDTATTSRLTTRCADLERRLSLAQSQERAARAAARTAETAARTLREEMARLKAAIQQARGACANDVRKRDVQIQRLKTHLTAQQRGNRSALVGASITITPGATIGTGSGGGVVGGEHELGHALDLDDPAYSLKQETTEFLTQLSQGLSDENDNLIGLVRGALSTLRHLQGMPENLMRPADSTSSGGNAGDVDMGTDMVQALPSSYEALSGDMDTVLDSLKALLTSPNFVPIEEVSIREEEIARLRDGFEKLEGRWKEAIALMNSWRERMEKDGDTIDLAEIKQGLGLGIGFGASVYVSRPPDESSGMDDIVEESAELDDLHFDSAAEDDVREESPDVLLEARSLSQPRDAALKPSRALVEADGNSGSPRKVKFQKESIPTPPDEQENEVSEIDFVDLSPQKKPSSPDKVGASEQPASRLPRKALKRHSSHEDEPKLTVQEKLNVAQEEAEAAAGERASKARRINSGEKKTLPTSKGGSDQRGVRGKTGAQQDVPAVKRTRVTTGRPRRRKSTLTRDELADMLVGLI